MDVVVDQRHGKDRRHYSFVRASLLGDGMLERARATTLGLLGAAGAVGLAMIALAFNQGWPLVAGGPVPPLPPREQDVAKARVAATPSAHRRAAAGAASRPRGAGGHSGGTELSQVSEDDSTPGPSSELVVVPAAPVEQRGDSPRPGPHVAPAPAEPKTPPASQTQTEDAEQTPVPPSPAVSPPAPPAPPATVSEAPESSVPSWSHGKGHAYGRAGREDGDED